MHDPLQAVLDFALGESKQAEALFCALVSMVGDPDVQALFAQRTAAERGRTEMLSRMTPQELAPAAADIPDLAELLIFARLAPTPTLDSAVRAAIERKTVTAALYDRIALLRGEACSFFLAMAAEDRRTVQTLERLDARSAPEAPRQKERG